MELVCLLVHTHAYWYMKLIPCIGILTPFEGTYSLIRVGFVACKLHISKQCETYISK